MKKIILLLSIVVLGLSVLALDKIPVTLSRIYDGDTIEIINENNQKENNKRGWVNAQPLIYYNVYILNFI